ncbi:hypothetical protein ACPOL_5545 [Acidisarcina polymorpha]|uniref:Uncharacterized protein n=1 Tax=Acidisarcina polymorpha TaxID=2211140 RepID=A0A2Z5G6A9_9BACT|nr:hypothetical protein ACPOL_5545 [Acidisarcina polymorpha]
MELRHFLLNVQIAGRILALRPNTNSLVEEQISPTKPTVSSVNDL